MKIWHFVAIAAVLGIAYVLINRPSVQRVPVSTSASNAQGILTLGTKLVSLGASIFSSNKAAAPSAVVDVGADQGTFTQGPSHVEGNTLVDDSGSTLTYGTD